MAEQARDTNDDVQLFGLIGYPLSHSFSGKYFADKFAREKLYDKEYKLFPLASIKELPALLRSNPALRGLNVTIPYKESVLAYLNKTDELAEHIGACNCIRIDNGILTGFNTDALGFERSLQEHLLPQHRKALVLGTGGAAKAVQFILRRLGIPFTLVSRSSGAGTITYSEITPEIIQQHLLIINTTPLGMHPREMEAPGLPYEVVTPSHYLYDLVYNPAKTLFLQRGEEFGATIKNGYDMLVLQAEESWKIWNPET